MDQFVNRIDELDRLQTLYESGAAELAIIYGRRQIGKSELVRQSSWLSWCADSNSRTGPVENKASAGLCSGQQLLSPS